MSDININFDISITLAFQSLLIICIT